MPDTLTDFLAAATRKSAADLGAALLRLPADKRDWVPMGKARTALDQVAECALLNGSTVDLIRSRVWAHTFDVAAYDRSRMDLARDEDAALARLDGSTSLVVAAIRAFPPEDLGIEIATPWAPMTLAQVLAYPYWNMTYHEGQITYIATLLGLQP